jgi:hypothetical protein
MNPLAVKRWYPLNQPPPPPARPSAWTECLPCPFMTPYSYDPVEGREVAIKVVDLEDL